MTIRALPHRHDFGSARVVAEASSNDTGSIALQEPVGKQFWLLGTGAGAAAFWYLPGASQDNGRAANMVHQHHNGTGGWQSVAITIIKKVPNVAWPGTLSIDATTTADMAYGLLMEPIGQFRGLPVRNNRISGASSTAFTMTMVPNTMLRPGGLAVVVTQKDNVGPTGFTGTGWQTWFVGRMALSVFFLPMSHIQTPPSIVYSSAGVADTWGGGLVYLR